MNIVLLTALVALAIAFALGTALGFFKQFFSVEEDPLISEIRELLPGVNCGGCGYAGCDGFAAALAEGTAEVSGCAPGGTTVAENLSSLLGGFVDLVPQVAFLACGGVRSKAVYKGKYIGVKSCRAGKISTGNVKLCHWACQGFGDCVKVCKFNAITMSDEGLPRINPEKCTGCKLCVSECPQSLIRLIPRSQKGAIALCSNMSVNRAMVARSCKAGCIKCELCVKNCPENCIVMGKEGNSLGLPVIDYSKCTSCGVCLTKCPTKVLMLT